jgi:hypothetical protein
MAEAGRRGHERGPASVLKAAQWERESYVPKVESTTEPRAWRSAIIAILLLGFGISAAAVGLKIMDSGSPDRSNAAASSVDPQLRVLPAWLPGGVRIDRLETRETGGLALHGTVWARMDIDTVEASIADVTSTGDPTFIDHLVPEATTEVTVDGRSVRLASNDRSSTGMVLASWSDNTGSRRLLAGRGVTTDDLMRLLTERIYPEGMSEIFAGDMTSGVALLTRGASVEVGFTGEGGSYSNSFLLATVRDPSFEPQSVAWLYANSTWNGQDRLVVSDDRSGGSLIVSSETAGIARSLTAIGSTVEVTERVNGSITVVDEQTWAKKMADVDTRTPPVSASATVTTR